MANSIPFEHPSLILGSVVNTQVLDKLTAIMQLQLQIDTVQEQLNSYVLMKRSLTMTLNELSDMQVDTSELSKKIKELDNTISESATNYLQTRITSEQDILSKRQELRKIGTVQALASPVNFTSSRFESIPLAYESLRFDSQFFSYKSNVENTLSDIQGYIQSSLPANNVSSEVSARKVSEQITQQVQNHNIAGTLIVTSTCTHQAVRVFKDLVLEPGRAAAVWNETYPEDAIQINDQLQNDGQVNNSENYLSLISGAQYGSTFIGLVHILESGQTSSGLSDDLIRQIEEKVKIGGWIKNMSGGIGTYMKDVKKMLNTHNVSCHVSLIVNGAIPSVKASSSEKKMSSFSPNLDPPVISGDGNPKNEAIKSADAARAVNGQLKYQRSITKELIKADRVSNNSMDMETLLTAYDNYLTGIKDPSTFSGAPISFMTTKIYKREIIKVINDNILLSKSSDTKKLDENIKKD